MKPYRLILLSFCLALSCSQSGIRSECFVAFEPGAGEVAHETAASCSKALPPASTFKIPNALIALEAKTIRADETVEWDGFEHPFAAWNRDHDMASAIRYSVVWYFQEAASRIEPQRMQSFLKQMEYGSGDITRNPFMFWLTGEYRITPVDQLRFLRRFFAGEVPGISRRHQSTVQDFLEQPAGELVSAAGNYDFGPGTLQAKTGFVDLPDGFRTSWLVGRITRDERSILFVSSVYGTDKTIAGLSATRHAKERLNALFAEQPAPSP